MRKATTVKPQMWTKPRFLRLSSNARFVYSFLITGPDTNLTGIVRYPNDMVSMCTGISAKASWEALEELVKAGRILWDSSGGVIFIIRWLKHNPLNSPKLTAGYLEYLKAFDGHPFAVIAKDLLRTHSYDTVSIEYQQGMYTLQGQGQGQDSPVLSPVPVKNLPTGGSGATPKPVASPAVAMMPVKDGEEPITEADVALWESLYGRIDVRATLNKMVGYWAALPRNKRKTRAGIRKSINTWLAKDDDRAPVSDGGKNYDPMKDGFEDKPWM